MSSLPSRKTLLSSTKYERITTGSIPFDSFYCYNTRILNDERVWNYNDESGHLKIQDFPEILFFKERKLTKKGNKIIICQT